MSGEDTQHSPQGGKGWQSRLNAIPILYFILACLTLGLAPFTPEPHVWEKLKMLAAGDLLGILGQDPQEWLQGADSDDAISADAIESLIAERQQAKLDKDYARADEIRAELAARGVVLEDSREGTRWKRA